MQTRTGVPPLAIVAFDGLIADTVRLRARALHAAVQSGPALTPRSIEFFSVEAIVDVLHGRTFAEATREIAKKSIDRGDCDGAVLDETALDLVAHDASRRFRGTLQHGVSLVRGAAEWLAELGRTHRIAARADSARQDVNTVVTLASLESSFLFIRCSDDAPRLPSRPSLDASWAAIDTRLAAVMVPRERRIAFESDPRCAATAQPFVASVEIPTFRHAITGSRAERE